MDLTLALVVCSPTIGIADKATLIRDHPPFTEAMAFTCPLITNLNVESCFTYFIIGLKTFDCETFLATGLFVPTEVEASWTLVE
jgi:hypothetical protein